MGELAEAIAEGEAAQVRPYLLKEPRRLLQRERPKEEARQLLAQCIASGDEGALQRAILRAEEVRLADADLREAQRALVAVRRRALVDKLQEATHQRDEELLAQSVRRAEEAGVDEESLQVAREVLAEVRTSAARDLLQRALSGGAVLMEAAIVKGREVGLPEQEIAVVLKSLIEARTNDLKSFMKWAEEKQSTEGLADAINLANVGGVAEHHLADAFLTLALLQATASRTQRNATGLAAALLRATEAELPDERLAVAREMLAEADAWVVDECCICFSEDVETFVMQCCGREGGSNRICSNCQAFCFSGISPRCPFCRADLSD